MGDGPSRRGSAGDARLPPALLALGVSIAALYGRVVTFDFVNFDDFEYVVDNPHLREGFTLESVHWAFTTLRGGNWHPLTWLSHLLDYRLFGLDPGGPHLVNAALHAASSLVLLLVLRRLTGSLWRSLFVAAAFALHPLRVESVAWVSERKDVLSVLFWILAMGAYGRYAARPTGGRYLAVAVPFTLGLLSKPTLVTLPLMLLLLDVWPLGRFLPRRDGWSAAALLPLVREKGPLLFLSIAAAGLTLLAPYRLGIFTPGGALPLADRVVTTVTSYAAYLGKALWPAGLAAIYPLPKSWDGWTAAASLLLLALVSALAAAVAGRRPAPAVGWLWYLVTVLPTTNFLHIGPQVMADRYTYVPFIGVGIGVAWAVPARLPAPWRRLAAAAAAIAVAGWFGASWRQVGYWRDSLILFQHTLAVTEGNFAAHTNLAYALAMRGRVPEAEAHYRRALAARPDYVPALMNLGVLLEREGRTAEAEACYREVQRLSPGYADAWWDLGHLLARAGRTGEAGRQFAEYLRLRPEEEGDHVNAARALLAAGNAAEAEAVSRALLRRFPRSAGARVELGRALAASGRLPEAIEEFSRAAGLEPGNASIELDLGAAHESAGAPDEAARHYRRALGLGADPAAVRERLAALSRAGPASRTPGPPR